MKLAAKQLEHVSRLVLKALGCKEKEAVIVSRHLVEANLRGHPSHGIGMLPFYVASVRNKTLRPNQAARLVRDAGAILQFSGERGFGQRVAREAVDAAIWRVRETGVALLTVRNAHHMGRIGCYGEQLANAGLVGLFFVNVTDVHTPMVSPFGGTAGRFGGNPICIAFPGTDKHPAFILDFATSRVSYGKTRVAYLAGQRFEEPVLQNHAGHPSHDPRVMWEEPQGTLRPMAHHKGGGLLAATEFLAGLLSGGGTSQPGAAAPGWHPEPDDGVRGRPGANRLAAVAAGRVRCHDRVHQVVAGAGRWRPGADGRGSRRRADVPIIWLMASSFPTMNGMSSAPPRSRPG
ncbi:Ldh family oxidoreductase [Pseudogulbenkiania ferrooxidans]|uniref:Malate/L-lactate dehydrogenase n=1 Tax=Pseudogulbenkiania ferrooxidans 2002 TaxID=279714 RepID=B9Z109_9NEIS|nr:Ldh family oxidoreductase [Pseudogulbenkiania ferrooxidans]EEG09104.1 Malate/L-lactate dehydrogenase [Pseudogulbenkiania ferrooxidans 2002]